MKTKPKKETYRVWFDQVNQTWLEVSAKDAEEASIKAQRKWTQYFGRQASTSIERQDHPVSNP